MTQLYYKLKYKNISLTTSKAPKASNDMSTLMKKVCCKAKNLIRRKSNDEKKVNGVNSMPEPGSESVCCRICNINDGRELLFNPCSCVGNSAFIHRKCLVTWFQRARYDVLCCDCKSRYVRIKYKHHASFMFWLKEEPKVRNHLIIGAIVFPLIFIMVSYGIVKAAMSNTGDIFKVLFVPTLAFGILTLWKFVGSVAIIINEYQNWKNANINANCDHDHKKHKTE